VSDGKKHPPDWSFQCADNVLLESLGPENIAMIRNVAFFIHLRDISVYKLSENHTENINLSIRHFEGVLHRMPNLQHLKVRIKHRNEALVENFFNEGHVHDFEL